MVMVMNGFDTNFDRANEVYAANTDRLRLHGPADRRRSVNELVRLYIVNVLEYDLINSFHLHGNLFDYYPTGTSKTPSELTDTIMLCQGQRGIARVALPASRPVHVPRPPVRVHRARLAGHLRGRVMGTATRSVRLPAWVLGLVPLLLVAGGIALFALLDAPGDRRADRGRRPRSWRSSGPWSKPGDDPAHACATTGRTRSRSRRPSSTMRSRSSPAPSRRSGGSRPRPCGSRSPGSRASPTRSRCSRRPAGRSCTRSPSRSIHSWPTRASSA